MLVRELALALVPALFSALPARAQEPRAPDGGEALAPAAEALGAWLAARDAGADLEPARADLMQRLAELRGALEADPLARPEVLAALAWRAAPREARVRAGKVEDEVFRGGRFAADGLAWSWRVPRDYDPARAWPLVLSLPDEDETPAQHLRTRWTSSAVLDGAILVTPRMPAARAEWDRVMVDGRPGGLAHALTALRLATRRFAVDPDRVYVAGRGKAVPAAVAAANCAPQRFAGVVGRAGDAGAIGPENLASLPVLFAGGGARATAFQEAAAGLGCDCTVDPLAKEEDVWRWMGERRRVALPERVTVAPGDPFPTRAYWLRIAPTAPDARVTATVDRAANRIAIEGAGAAQATLYLSDALVDLDRPLRVVCNGVENELRVPRSLAAALDLLVDGTSDAGCVYVAEVAFDLSGAAPPRALAEGAGPEAALAARLAAAGDDPAALWALHEELAARGAGFEDAGVLRRLVRLAPDHAAARAALGHVRAGERWFSSPAARARFERGQDPAGATARGHVEHKGLWMHPDERARVNKAAVKDPETGQWLTVADRRRLEQGWARQDLAWIPPEEAAHVDAGQWLVDGEWCDPATANRRHAHLSSMWVLPRADVWLHTTVDREVALRAMDHMARALDDLNRVFGAEPPLPLRVALLRDEEQYDTFAFGAPDGRRPPTHLGRRHVIHSAYLAESWFERAGGELAHLGMGVGYWDALVPDGDAYGVHSGRLALGLSYVDALDRSPKAVRRALADGPGPDFDVVYAAEKRLPEWLRYGGAVYAERFFRDATVGEGGEAWWARAWSLENLRARGGWRGVDPVLAFPLDTEDRADGLKLLLEAGLLVAFAVDGGCAPVEEAHAALKRALAAGRVRPSQVAALEDALRAHEAALLVFAGLE